MAHQVFVSHSAGDKPIADAICAKLEGQQIRVWIAPRDIVPSSDWEESIANAIRSCSAMVLVFSSKANLSTHIKREVELAIRAGKPVIPFRIEDVQPSGALEYQLGTVHWLDAITPPLDTHLNRLVGTVSMILNGPGPSPPPGPPPPRPAPPPPPPTSHKGRNAAIGLAVIGVAILAAIYGSKPTPRPYFKDQGQDDRYLEPAQKRTQVKPAEDVPTEPAELDQKPVTPKVTRPAPAADVTAIYGDWSGSYQCMGVNNGLAFRFYQVEPGHTDVYVSFPFNQMTGRYRSHVTYDPASGSIEMRPEQWIMQPPGVLLAAPFSGSVNIRRGLMQGRTVLAGCTGFQVSKQ